MDLAARIEMAKGNRPVDVLLKNGRLVNVLSGEIHPASIALHQDLIVGMGDYDAIETVDLNGLFIAPGFIDGHLHIESSMLSPREFARNVVPKGTTSLVADPHEIANVLGAAGIRYMIDSSEGLPLRVFLMFPSCVPATPFETSGAELVHSDMAEFKDHPRIAGLAEVMNFPGAVGGDPEILAKIHVFRDKVIDGHAPGLSGRDLCAYAAAGIGSDHECTNLQEAQEKLRLGMRVMIREGSAAKNLDALFPLVAKLNSRRCLLVTDDLEPRDIVEKGHINHIVEKAVSKGMDPVQAVQMVTLNPASYFRLAGLGAVAPGYIADLAILEDLDKFEAVRVYHAGRLVAEQGRMLEGAAGGGAAIPASAVNVDWGKVASLSIPVTGRSVNVIEVVPGQIVTKRVVEEARVVDGEVRSDTDRDILKIAVIERHKGTGNYSVGLIKGFGLKSGAIASTVAHDSHNIVVVGVHQADMLAAARHVAALGGGMAVAQDSKPIASLALPIAGLMSDQTIERVNEGLEAIVKAAHDLGCALENPFATLSFMALTPIPELKMTDLGLFDSVNFRFVSLFAV
jgi:adenine deaminase